MDFGVLLLIAGAIIVAVGLPITFYTYNKYRKLGKSVKYLEFKIAFAVGLPIFTIVVFLNEELSVQTKFIMIFAMAITGIVYAYTITFTRKILRKIMGLPSEDEHTGEVIKDDKKLRKE